MFTYDVSLDRDWAARSARGGTAIPNEEAEWTPEHLVLAGALPLHPHELPLPRPPGGPRAGASASAHGVVTRREEDGRFAFVEIRVDLDVTLDPLPGRRRRCAS